MENKLTAEQMKKLKTCKTAEEANALADEQLEEVSGGGDFEGLKGFPYTTSPAENVGTCPFCKKEVYNLQQHKQTCSAKRSDLFQGL